MYAEHPVKIVQVLFKNAHPIVCAQSVTLVTLRQYVGGVGTTIGIVELAQVPKEVKNELYLRLLMWLLYLL